MRGGECVGLTVRPKSSTTALHASAGASAQSEKMKRMIPAALACVSICQKCMTNRNAQVYEARKLRCEADDDTRADRGHGGADSSNEDALLSENQLALTRDAQAIVEAGMTDKQLMTMRADELFARETAGRLDVNRLGARKISLWCAHILGRQ